MPMAKLWQKTYDLDETIERFTAGEDVELDVELVGFDVLGSIAHARMLAHIGILKKSELKKLQNELVKIFAAAERGEFTITPAQEDVHTLRCRWSDAPTRSVRCPLPSGSGRRPSPRR